MNGLNKRQETPNIVWRGTRFEISTRIVRLANERSSDGRLPSQNGCSGCSLEFPGKAKITWSPETVRLERLGSRRNFFFLDYLFFFFFFGSAASGYYSVLQGQPVDTYTKYIPRYVLYCTYMSGRQVKGSWPKDFMLRPHRSAEDCCFI